MDGLGVTCGHGINKYLLYFKSRQSVVFLEVCCSASIYTEGSTVDIQLKTQYNFSRKSFQYLPENVVVELVVTSHRNHGAKRYSNGVKHLGSGINPDL